MNYWRGLNVRKHTDIHKHHIMISDDEGKMGKHKLDLSDKAEMFTPIVKTTMRLLSEINAKN